MSRQPILARPGWPALLGLLLVLLCPAAPAHAGPDEERAEQLRQIAVRQFWPPVPHRYEAIAWFRAPGRDWSRVSWEGPLPFDGYRSRHHVHPDGWYRVVVEDWQVVDKSGRPKLGLQHQGGWNGELAFQTLWLQWQQDGGRPDRPTYMHGSDATSDRLRGCAWHAAGFNGVSRLAHRGPLVLFLREQLPADATYGRTGDREELRFSHAGGHWVLRFAEGRVVGWTARWGDGDELNGKRIPFSEQVGRTEVDTLLSAREDVTFTDFRPTSLGVELPHEATITSSVARASGGTHTNDWEVRRRNVEPMPTADRSEFSPLEIPAGTPVLPFDGNGGSEFIWDGTRAVLNEQATAAAARLPQPTRRGREAPLWANSYLYLAAGAAVAVLGAVLIFRRRRQEGQARS